MKPLTIEIFGTGTHNRGAELMASAIAERLRSSIPEVRIVVPPSFGPLKARGRYDFFTTWEIAGGLRTRLVAGVAMKFASASVNQVCGIVDPKEVDVVLDASGFSFSDQWGPSGAVAILKKMNSPRRRHQPLILLPQALGPFRQPEVIRATRDLIARASLVCARDKISYEAVKPLCDQSKLRLYPDFTVGVSPHPPENFPIAQPFSAIIPNMRMIDKTESADHYLGFLSHAVKSLQARNLNPAFVLHDADGDRRVVQKLADRGCAIPVLEHSDPRVLKGILGRATLVIGSRFHGLVGSLSQGVPCIGAGWSHKYPELFEDFGCGDLLLSDLRHLDALDRMLDALADATLRDERRKRLLEAANRLKAQTLEMWREVETLIQTRNSGRRSSPVSITASRPPSSKRLNPPRPEVPAANSSLPGETALDAREQTPAAG